MLSVQTPEHVKQILKDINGETDNNIINIVIVRDVNTPLTSQTDHPDRKLLKQLNDLKWHTKPRGLFRQLQHINQNQQNTHSFQVYMEHSQDISHTRPENKCKQI